MTEPASASHSAPIGTPVTGKEVLPRFTPCTDVPDPDPEDPDPESFVPAGVGLVEDVGVDVGVGVAEGVGDWVGVGDGDGVGLVLGVGVGEGVADAENSIGMRTCGWLKLLTSCPTKRSHSF